MLGEPEDLVRVVWWPQCRNLATLSLRHVEPLEAFRERGGQKPGSSDATNCAGALKASACDATSWT